MRNIAEKKQQNYAFTYGLEFETQCAAVKMSDFWIMDPAHFGTRTPLTSVEIEKNTHNGVGNEYTTNYIVYTSHLPERY